MIKISAVSYLNTLPFAYGIEKSDYIKNNSLINRDIPSECARKLKEYEVDLGLVPVAVIPEIETPFVISDFCIGAVGKVHSVNLYSHSPIDEIDEIVLDYQSKTSVNLCKVLCKYHWRISPKFIQGAEGYEQQIQPNQAAVIIGDRTFKIGDKFPFVYDLSEEWYLMTRLPFVFAAWVSNKPLPEEYISAFNSAAAFGLEHIREAILFGNISIISPEEQYVYLTKSISYSLDEQKRKGLAHFLTLLKTVS
jgi:chorismate dehydratase